MKKLLLIFTLLTASLSFSQDESIAKIDEFLNFMNKPHYLNGDLTINANIKNIDNNNWTKRV